jgi:hypothetical protein
MTLTQFKEITQLEQFPQYLQKDVNGDVLKVYSNGEINYTIKGVHAKASVIWAIKLQKAVAIRITPLCVEPKPIL